MFNYYYKCFNRIIKVSLYKPKTENLDFWLQRFCPSVIILADKQKSDFSIICLLKRKSDYIDYRVKNKKIYLYGKLDNYESYLAKFITQTFQSLLIKDDIFFLPSACIYNKHNECVLIIGDYWQGKTTVATKTCEQGNYKILTDNYIAIKNDCVIGGTKFLSTREQINQNDVKLVNNNRYFFENKNNDSNIKLQVKEIVLPYINSANLDIHLISHEESVWFLYQKFTKLLSGESILYNGKIPSPSFLNKFNCKKLLKEVNLLMCKFNINYISAGIDVIVQEISKILI